MQPLNVYSVFTAEDGSYRFQYPENKWTAPAKELEGSVTLHSCDPTAQSMIHVTHSRVGSTTLIGFMDQWFSKNLSADPRNIPSAHDISSALSLGGYQAVRHTFTTRDPACSNMIQPLQHRVVLCVPPNGREDAFVLRMIAPADQRAIPASGDFDRMVSSFQILLPGLKTPVIPPAQLTSRKAGITLSFPGNWVKCTRTGWDASLRIFGPHGEQNGEAMSLVRVPGPIDTLDALAELVSKKIHPLPQAAVLSQSTAIIGREPGLIRILSYAFSDGIERQSMEALTLHAGDGLLVAYEATVTTFDAYVTTVIQTLDTVEFVR